MSSPTKTIGEMLEYGQTLFEKSDIYFGHGTDNAWDEAVYLLSHVLDLPPDADRSLLDNSIPVAEQNKIEALFQRRIDDCLLYTSPSPRDGLLSRMPSSA